MSELKLQKVFLLVSVEDELPPKQDERYGIIIQGNECIDSAFYTKYETWTNLGEATVTHWLKEQEGYFFSKDELKSLLQQTYNAQDGQLNAKPSNSFEAYIKQLNL